MSEYLVIVIFIVWYVLSMVISEGLGKKKRLGVEWSFFWCIMLSPLVGFVIVRFSKDKEA